MKELSGEYKKHIHLKSSSGELDNSFVGLRIIGDNVFIHHPESYQIRINDDSFSEDVLSLLNTFSLTKSLSSERGMTYSGDSDGEFRLESYIWIINDFLKRGFYINREKRYGINQKGKISWKRTYNQNPIVSNNNVIYTNLVTEKIINTASIVVSIHKYCVKKSIDFIGWLFGLNSHFIESPRIDEDLKSYYLSILEEELDNTFDDYKKELFKNMIFVIRGLSDYDKNDVVNYGVDQYHSVFEKMIDRVFGNMNAKNFYPKGKWKLKELGLFDSSSLRPDTVMKIDKSIYIIDSKYYRYGSSGNPNDLPETSSIQKQIAYAEYAKKLNPESDIFNAFIIPYNKQKNTFHCYENLFYIGKAYTEVENQNKNYHYVHSFLIDLKHLIKTFNRYNHDIEILQIVNDIKANTQ